MDLSQNDEFFTFYDKIKKTLSQIKVLSNDRIKSIAKNEPILEIDLNVKNKLLLIEQSSNKIKEILEDYNKKPTISQNEVTRRTKLFNELMNSEKIIKNQYNSMVLQEKMNKQDVFEMTTITRKEEPQSNNENLSQETMEKYNKQDETFDTYIGIVKKIKNNGKEIGNEMDSHKPLIEKMEKNIDRVDRKLEKTENNLKKYLERTSDGVIWKVIIAELVILLIFIII